MASFWFLKLALKCLDHFAWPLLALGYPLCASVQAIETDSYKETRDLISYWILLSLIYLFEYAFLRVLQWFQFWPYIKLMIIFWLIIPDFGRASYAYNNLIRPCISLNTQAVICRLNNWRKFFVKKDDFLLHAERYVKENGTEALEKLIASKNTTNKPDAEATNAIRATDNKEMQQTNEKKLQTEHKAIKDLEVIEKKEIPAGKQDIPVMPNLAPSQNASSAMAETKGMVGKQILTNDIPVMPNLAPSQNASSAMAETKGMDIPVMPNLAPSQNASSAMAETKGMAGKDTAGGELPQSSTHKEVQKEWTCALCQVTTTSENTLNMHLHGRKHRAAFEALKAKNQPGPPKLKSDQSKEELKQKNIINQPNSKIKNGESKVNNGLKGKEVMDHKVQELQKNPREPVGMNHSKLLCEVCNVFCPNEVAMVDHLTGKKHLAKIKSLSEVYIY